MPFMFVMLEVSKLSGWLNDDAPCRESKGGHTRCGASRGPESGRGLQTTAAQEACRGGLDCIFGGKARAGAHVEHAGHVRDAGGVEA